MSFNASLTASERLAEPRHPSKLVFELVGAHLASVREVGAEDRHTVDLAADQPSLRVVFVVTKALNDVRDGVPADDGHSVVGLLPRDYGLVPALLNFVVREVRVGHLQLLQTQDVGLCRIEPVDYVLPARPDRVYVPRGDLHASMN